MVGVTGVVRRLRNGTLASGLVLRVLQGVLRVSGKRVSVVRIGSRYGGWWVPESSLVEGAVAYCGGAGEDISFDNELARHGLEVWTFDPTPRAIHYVREHGLGINFEPVGWWSNSCTLRFYAPANNEHVSYSVDNLQGSEEFFDAKVQTVHELAHERGHQTIDILKMDIEGAESEVLPTLLAFGPAVKVLCIEFDYPFSTYALISLLVKVWTAGYKPIKVEHQNVTFFNGGM